MMLVYFPLGGCIDDVVNNRLNYQFTSVIVIHFINGTEVCLIIRRTVFNLYICTTIENINTTKLKGMTKNQDIKGSFFKI